ncbi:MAG: carboxypeptidase-like regulatory domain-containing protein, partial [Vicinamibacterales bacterium]
MISIRSACLWPLQAAFLVLLYSTMASAQSVISGQVRDTSGAVLPGVSVEASSPVLIEKVRTVVSDDQGRYTIVDLRPGTYRVADQQGQHRPGQRNWSSGHA